MQIANLQEEIAKEVEMNAPELAKLQGLSARIAGNQGEWGARQETCVSRRGSFGISAGKSGRGSGRKSREYLAPQRMTAADGWEWKLVK